MHMVSIIIPCYNDFAYIESSVQSALEQTYSDKEIIVIDDGSDARTKEILKRIAPKITKLITQENQGVVIARNIAIEAAKGDYILTLDSDDYFEPQFLEKAIPVLQEQEKVGIVTSWVSIINERGEPTGMFKPSGAPASEAIFRNNAPGSILFRKICWKETGGYDPEMAKGNEDWEFNVSVCKNGWDIYVIPEILFNYRLKKSSRNKSALIYRRQIRQYAFRKHSDLLINNLDKTIDFFLNEIENKETEIIKIKNSSSFILGELLLKPVKWLKSYL
jgi:glycosyltransferase involved in cell wall biosynthesis